MRSIYRKDVRPLRAITSLLFIATALATVGATADPGGEDRFVPGFFRVSDEKSVPWAYDLVGETLAWAARSDNAVEIRLTNLTTKQHRVLSSIPPLGAELKIGSLAFDGRWVVWSDNRFGNFEVFAVDSTTLSLQRVSESSADETDVDVDGGIAVWSRGSAIRLADLARGEASTLHAAPGAVYQPVIHQDWVAWAQLNGSERYVVVADRNGGSPQSLSRQASWVQYAPDAEDGALVYETRLVGQPAPGLAPIVLGAVIQLVPLPPGPVRNLTDFGTAEGPSIGGGRISWVERYEEPILRVERLDGSDEFSTEGVFVRALVSETYLVVTDAVPDEIDRIREDVDLYARSWSWKGRGGIPAPALVCGLAAVLLAGLALQPRVRRA